MSYTMATIITYIILALITAFWYTSFYKLVNPKSKELGVMVFDLLLILACTLISTNITLELIIMMIK